MKQNCVETLNQHEQPLENNCLSQFHQKHPRFVERPRPLRNVIAEKLTGPSDSTAIGWNK